MKQRPHFKMMAVLLLLMAGFLVLSACGEAFPEDAVMEIAPENTATPIPEATAATEAFAFSEISEISEVIESSERASTPEQTDEPEPIGMPDDYDLPVSEVPELVPDVLSIRERTYEDMPLLTTQNQVSEYALWNLLWGRTAFECYLPREMVPYEGAGHVILSTACKNMEAYYLFSAYREFDMYTEDRGDEQGVYAKVTLIFEGEDYDLEARAEALEFVMKNPVPEGRFQDYESELEYALKIHDYLAKKVTYSPVGYNPQETFGADRYENKQEAYTCLGEDQDSTVCAGYARGFALIAQYAGINAAWVWGNETEESSHAWNILYPCDGSEPVLIDVTWDDTASFDREGQTEVETIWFYVPLSQVYDHIPDESMADFLNYLNQVNFTVG